MNFSEYYSLLYLFSSRVYYSDICSNDYSVFNQCPDCYYTTYNGFVDEFWSSPDDMRDLVKTAEGSLENVGYISLEPKKFSTECIQILETSKLAPADCSIPLHCGPAQWRGLQTRWYGEEIGVCYSIYSPSHSVSELSLYSINSTFGSASHRIQTFLKNDEIYIVKNVSSDLYSIYDPICQYSKIYLDNTNTYSVGEEYSIEIRGRQVCFSTYIGKNCDFNWQSLDSLMREINPVMIAVVPAHRARESFESICRVSRVKCSQQYGVLNLKTAFKCPVYGLYRLAEGYASNMTCLPIHTVYRNPASLLVSSALNTLLAFVVSLFSSLFNDLEGLFEKIFSFFSEILVIVFVSISKLLQHSILARATCLFLLSYFLGNSNLFSLGLVVVSVVLGIFIKVN